MLLMLSSCIFHNEYSVHFSTISNACLKEEKYRAYIDCARGQQQQQICNRLEAIYISAKNNTNKNNNKINIEGWRLENTQEALLDVYYINVVAVAIAVLLKLETVEQQFLFLYFEFFSPHFKYKIIYQSYKKNIKKIIINECTFKVVKLANLKDKNNVK